MSRSLTPGQAVQAVARYCWDMDWNSVDFLREVQEIMKKTRPPTCEERLRAFRKAMTRTSANGDMTYAERWSQMLAIHAEFRMDIMADNSRLRRLVVDRRRRLRRQGQAGQILELQAQVRGLEGQLREERNSLREAVRQLNDLRELNGMETNRLTDDDQDLTPDIVPAAPPAQPEAAAAAGGEAVVPEPAELADIFADMY